MNYGQILYIFRVNFLVYILKGQIQVYYEFQAMFRPLFSDKCDA